MLSYIMLYNKEEFRMSIQYIIFMTFYRCDDQCFEITVVIKSDVDE